jgi:hypothetical protein
MFPLDQEILPELKEGLPSLRELLPPLREGLVKDNPGSLLP